MDSSAATIVPMPKPTWIIRSTAPESTINTDVWAIIEKEYATAILQSEIPVIGNTFHNALCRTTWSCLPITNFTMFPRYNGMTEGGQHWWDLLQDYFSTIDPDYKLFEGWANGWTRNRGLSEYTPAEIIQAQHAAEKVMDVLVPHPNYFIEMVKYINQDIFPKWLVQDYPGNHYEESEHSEEEENESEEDKVNQEISMDTQEHPEASLPDLPRTEDAMEYSLPIRPSPTSLTGEKPVPEIKTESEDEPREDESAQEKPVPEIKTESGSDVMDVASQNPEESGNLELRVSPSDDGASTVSFDTRLPTIACWLQLRAMTILLTWYYDRFRLLALRERQFLTKSGLLSTNSEENPGGLTTLETSVPPFGCFQLQAVLQGQEFSDLVDNLEWFEEAAIKDASIEPHELASLQADYEEDSDMELLITKLVCIEQFKRAVQSICSIRFLFPSHRYPGPVNVQTITIDFR